MKTFLAKAMGDSMYFAAPDLDDAKAQMVALCGEGIMPHVEWTEAEALPDGEEYAADCR